MPVQCIVEGGEKIFFRSRDAVGLAWRWLFLGRCWVLRRSARLPDEETDGYFSDDDGSVHEPALEALASRGVLAGIECGEGLICPSEPLKRWEMAVWLARVLDGAHPGSVDTERFSDVDYDMWWAPSVEQLFDSGITVGCRRDPLQYCPHNPVTRAQMATFLKRAFDLEPAPSAGFTDVSGGSHGANIDALAAAGITVGCSRDPLRYCPTRSVTRGQMASFLARALGLIELPGAMRFTAVDAGVVALLRSSRQRRH